MTNHVVFYDNLSIDDEEYNNRVREITDYYVWVPDGFERTVTKNLTETLLNLSKDVTEENKWILVNTYGHAINSNSLDVWFNKAVSICEKENSPLMAHVLQDSENDWYKYPSFHEQCFVIDLLEWKRIGYPAFEPIHNTNATLKEVVRSEENFHDHYTPLWVGPGTTENTVTLDYRMFGSQVVEKFIEAGHRIINFDQELRERKWHLYPNENYDEWKRYFETGEMEDTANGFYLVNQINGELESLKDTVYILNTEEIKPKVRNGTFKKPIDHYIFVAGGFKPALLIHEYGFHKDTKATCLDISSGGIIFQKFMRENWDGDLGNYSQKIDEFSAKYPNSRLAWRSWNSMDSEIDAFLSEVNLTREEFKKIWQNYCSLEFDSIELNLIEDTTKLEELLKNSDRENFYIWISNAFNMQWIAFRFGIRNAEDKLLDLKKKFAQIAKKDNKSITLEESMKQTVYNC